MEIIIEGPYDQIINEAKSGKIPKHLVVGIEVYRTPECAKEDKVKIDLTRKFSYGEVRHLLSKSIIDYFFSSRFYEIIDLTDIKNYISCCDIAELKAQLMVNEIGKANFLDYNFVNGETEKALYLHTPLKEKELSDLLKAA